jgi:phage gp45-like
MVVKGKIARIDVDTGTVTTEDGVKIGDTEDKVKSVYGDELQVQPHKYIEGGHYMTVKGDSASAGKAIVFETDGKRVTMFRAGRIPEVEWVEGCG